MAKNSKTTTAINSASSDSTKRLAAKLKELRNAYGYTQEYVADVLDIKQATYSNYELGKRTPGSVFIYKIANFYGLPADDLMKLVLPLDDEIFFDAVEPTTAMADKDDFLRYMKSTSKVYLSREERELIYHFKRLTVAGKQEVIDFAEFKRYNVRRSVTADN